MHTICKLSLPINHQNFSGNLALASHPKAPSVAALMAIGKEDHDLPLHITAVDGRGRTNTLQLSVSGLPVGATLSVGHKDAQGAWVIPAGTSLQGLHLTPGANWFGHGMLYISAQQPNGMVTHSTMPYTILPVQDKAVITGTDTGSTTEDQLLHAAGILQVTDPDPGEALFTPASVSSALGTFKIDAHGHWGFDLNNAALAVQQLAAGTTTPQVFTVYSKDGTSHQVQVFVTGTNDGPVLSSSSASAREDGAVVSGQMVGQDPDATDQLQYQAGGTLPGGFAMAPDGHWTLDPTDAAYQSLRAGEVQTIVIPVTVTDGHGGSATSSLTLTVTGTNDGPHLSASTAGASEDGRPVSGQMHATDADHGDSATFAAVNQPAGFAIQPDGSWSFDPTGSAYQSLGVGQQMVLHVPVTVTDGAGTTSSSELVITVAGTNDGPHLAAASSTATEDGAVVSGRMVGTDVDGGDTQRFTTSAPGFALNPDGSWTLDPTDGAYQSLGQGQQMVVRVPVTVTDGSGAKDTTDLEITIAGTNDGPVVGGAVSLPQGTEDKAVHLTAQQLLGQATDVDSGDHLLVHGLSVDHGSITANPDGSFTFTPDANYAGPVAFAYTVTDGHGGTAPGVAGLVLSPVGDPAVISGNSVAGVREDVSVQGGGLHSGGKLSVTDPDPGEDHFKGETLSGAHGGHLVMATDGSWTYSIDNSLSGVQSLGAGAHLQEQFTVHSADGTTHVITATVTGTNDAPVLSAAGGTASEGGSVIAGQVTSTDVDTGDSASYLAGAAGVVLPAGFAMAPDGAWTFDPTGPAYQSLGQGQQMVLHVPVTVTDGAGGTDTTDLVITVTGTNGAPVLQSATAGAKEDGAVVSGQMVGQDPDATDQLQYQAGGTLPGGFAMAPDGSWTLDPTDAAYQSLRAGEMQTIVIPVTVTDGHGSSAQSSLTLTVTGTNDGAVISGTSTGSAREDTLVTHGDLVVSGALTVTDTDHGEDHFKAETVHGAHGGVLQIDATGAWTYSIDNTLKSVQELPAGAVLLQTFTVHSADGTPHDITTALTGRNDGPVLTAATRSVTEDGAVASGQMVATDVDKGDTQAFSTTAAVAGFGLNPDGSWTFDPSNAAYQHIASGATQTITIPVTVTDGEGATDTQNLVITVHGQNDRAVIAGVRTGSVTEDSQVTAGKLDASGKLSITDPDSGEAAFVPLTPATGSGTYGQFAISANGAWAYSADNTQSAIQHLAAGQTLTDTVTVRSVDGTPHQIDITIHGTNDAPVLTAATASATEDGAQASGRMTATDVDTGDTKTFSTGTVAGFTMNTDGSWTFDPTDAAYQHLAAGQIQVVTIPVTVTDSQGATDTENLAITVTGTGDAAVIGGVDTGSVTENTAGVDMSPTYAQPGISTLGKAGLFFDGKLTITDPDSGEAVFDTKGLGYQYHGQFGDLILERNGSWHYVANAGSAKVAGGMPSTQGQTIDELGAGQSVKDTITIYAKDGTPHDIVVTIHGSNDRPYISSEVVLQSGTEDKPLTVSESELLGNTVDVDRNDAGKLTIAGLRADHGSIKDNQDGTYTFAPDRDYNGPVHFTYDVKDAHGGTTHTGASTTLAPVADTAVIGGVDTGSVKEDVHVSTYGTGATSQAHRLTASGSLAISDPDAGENRFTYSQFGEHAVRDPFGGNLHIDAHGNWGYVLNNDNPLVQKLAEGQVEHVVYRVRAFDGTTHDIDIEVRGTNDVPVLTAATASATEDGTQVSGTMTATDVDTGDTLVFGLGQRAPAGFTLNTDGSWSFDPTDQAYQHLADGQTEQVTIPVTVSDGRGSDTRNLVITVTGTNDAPVVSSPVALPAGQEDKAVPIVLSQLLAHATDIDTTDSLSVTGLTADHGVISGDAAHGFTFTPDANYSGPVQLAYTVTDGHGGTVGQTASLSLAAVGDPAVITDVTIPSVTEDRGYINTHYELQVYGKLSVTDPDPGEAKL